MTEGFIATRVGERITTIEERAESILRLLARCRTLLDKGLAVPVEGLPAHEIVRQYSELVSQNASLMAVQSDAIVKMLRELK